MKKAIILAAGLGTRFFPATKALSKEMLPIVDKPCIQYLVEEAVASGIKEIIIVVNPKEKNIQEHFNTHPELKKHLHNKGKKPQLNEIEKIDKLAKIHFVVQKEAKGDGHAILCAKNFIKEEPVVVLFGDDIYDSKIPALAQLLKQYKKTKAPIIALEKIDKKESEKYGMIKSNSSTNGLHKISALVEKPKPENAPSNLAITGKYILTPELFKTLAKAKSGHPDKELRLIDGMKDFVKHSPIYGYEIEGKRFDTGDKFGYLKAVLNFALKHKDLSPKIKSHLKSLI